MPKYELWGRAKRGERRKRLAFGFASEDEAREAMQNIIADGFIDVVPVQRPARSGAITGLQKRGLGKRKVD